MATLREHRSRPTLAPLNLTQVSVPDVVAKYSQAKLYLDKSGLGQAQAQPEHDALAFYLANAAYAKVALRVDPDAPLGEYDVLIENYQRIVRVTSLRLFFYLLLICTRESRHLHSDYSFNAKLNAKYGCMTFTQALKGQDSMGAASVMLTAPPKCLLGPYTDHLLEVFATGKFSAGYGGKAWADVTAVLRNFVHGVISAELMLDTGFTLAHNGGPIFNKGMLYHHYDSHELTKILDVQRAGMIPQLVASGGSSYVLPMHRAFQKEAERLLGPEFGGPVDWGRVSELGALKNYAQVKVKKKAPPPSKPFTSGVTGGSDSVVIAPGLALAKAKKGKRASA